MRLRISFVTAGGLSAIALLAASACSGGGDTASEVVSAISIIDAAGLHDIDDSINVDRKIPANARTVAIRLETVVTLTDWPGDLDDEAGALAGIFRALALALDGDNPDLAQAGEAAHTAHEAAHDFSLLVWAHLQKEAKVTGDVAVDDD